MKSRTDNISSEAKTSKGIAYDSRWMIISVIVLTLFLFCLEGRAQLVSSNPMEYVALAEGNELINSQIKNQIEDQQKTALPSQTYRTAYLVFPIHVRGRDLSALRLCCADRVCR